MAQQDAITISHPPAALLRVVNPILRSLLGTALMGPVRNQLMVLNFSGRKSGRQYSIPVSAHHIDNNLYALAGAAWKWNFRDGATAQVLYDGKTTTMHGELIGDKPVVADLYHRCAQSYGVNRAQRLMGMKFRNQQMPTLADFTEAVTRNGLIAIRFTPTR